MSVQAITWAYDQQTGSLARKAVLLALANCHNHHTGLCCPKVDTLAAEVEASEKTVRRALADLEELGMIERERERRSDGTLKTYTYRFPPLDSVSQPPVTLSASPAVTESGDPPVTESAQEPEVVLEPKPQVLTHLHDRQRVKDLWEVCEEHVQKAPTVKSPRAAYAKLVRELSDAGWSPERVIAAAAAYRKHPVLGQSMLTLAALAKWGDTFEEPGVSRRQQLIEHFAQLDARESHA